MAYAYTTGSPRSSSLIEGNCHSSLSSRSEDVRSVNRGVITHTRVSTGAGIDLNTSLYGRILSR